MARILVSIKNVPDAERAKMGGAGYVIVRDTTCRLFGFHGMTNGDKNFCLDHMFGF